jgi:hypothetical protein
MSALCHEPERSTNAPHRTPPLCTGWYVIYVKYLICKYIRTEPSRGPRINSRPPKDPDGHPGDGHRRSTASVSVTHHHDHVTVSASIV